MCLSIAIVQKTQACLHMDGEEAELLDAIRIGAIDDESSVSLVAAPPPVAQPLADDAEMADIDQLVVLGAAAPIRKHERRSWQHAEKARASKALKRERFSATEARRSLVLKEVEQQICVAQGANMAGGIRDKSVAHLNSLQLAACRAELACRPPIRGQNGLPHRQVVAASMVAKAVGVVQQSYLFKLFTSTSNALLKELMEDVPRGCTVSHRIHVYAAQWDEAAQRTQRLQCKMQVKGTLKSHEQTVNKVMMQAAAAYVVLHMTDGSELGRTVPICLKALRLESAKGKDYLAGFLRRCLLPLGDRAAMMQLCGAGDSFLIVLCMDRASANDVVTRHLFSSIMKLNIPNLDIHAEYCWCHGIAISKSRCKDAKNKGAAASSFSRMLRDGPFNGWAGSPRGPERSPCMRVRRVCSASCTLDVGQPGCVAQPVMSSF